jgi:YVTN family beta-propeller protein
MKHRRLSVSFFACLLVPCSVSGNLRRDNLLLVDNQMEHSVLLVDPMSKHVLATVGVDINGHEVAVSPDGRFGYVPIYGNTWVGMPGSNGSTIHVVDLRQGRTVAVIDLGKEVRSHSAHFGPDGLLYVSAELVNAIYIVDTKTRSLVGEIPTGASHTHMFVISPDGQRIYTANNEAGSISVLDVRARTLVATIPISEKVQRISISPDGKFVFTQDQQTPRIVVIDQQPTRSSDRFPSRGFRSLPQSQKTGIGCLPIPNQESSSSLMWPVAHSQKRLRLRMFPFYQPQENSHWHRTAYTPI